MTANNTQEPAHVLITGAASQIGSTIAFYIGQGTVFGHDRIIILHLFDLPRMKKKLEGYAIELIDCAFLILTDIICTDNIEEAFKDVDYAFFIESVPLKAGGIRSNQMHD